MGEMNRLSRRFAGGPSAGRLGFTAVELVIGITLAALLSSAIAAVLIHCLSGWSDGVGSAYAESEGDVALQRLLKEIQDGKTASVGDGALIVTFPLACHDQSSGETFYDRDADGEVRSYFLEDGTLVRQVGGAMTTVVRGVSSASFAVTSDTVAVTLTKKEQVGANCVTRQFTGRVTLRNRRSS